jgi:ATP-binding cassette, subfamily B, bacterial MsbA
VDPRFPSLDSLRGSIAKKTDRLFDAWLPSAGRKISLQHVIGGVLLFPLLVGIRGFIGYFSSYFMGWTSERVVNDMRVSVLEKITGLSLAFFDRAKTGDLLTRINGDTNALQRCFSVGFSDLIKEPVTILGVLTALCLIDWQLTLGSLVIFPICILLIMILGQKVRRAGRATVEVAVLQSSQLVEMFSGIRVIKAFGLEAAQVERFRRLSRELVSHTMRGLRAKEQINPIIETVAMFGFGMLILYIAYQGRQVSDMVSFLTGLVFLYTPVKKLASMHALFEQSRAGIERLVDILNQQTTVLEPSHPRQLHSFKEALEFKNVSFAYDRQPVLENLNVRLARGMKLGVAGESGSGKSTLVNLVLRYYDPTSGSLQIDGTDFREVSTQDLRKLMALVSQEIVLFDLTVAENIACGRPNATRAEIEEAARSAHAHEFIMRLPHGYDTFIG